MKNKIFSTISFSAMAVLIVMMMAATVFEKFKGTPFAFRYFYHSPLFIALWAVTAVSGLVYILSAKVQRNPATFGIHIALVVILAGALITHLTSESGELHLRLDAPAAEAFVDEDGNERALPFSVSLESFEIEYYTGSKRPSDFISTVVIDGHREVISMNNIARCEGYRFYQADFDQDRRGCILAVTHDPWGNGVTYAGYLLLALSMLGFFFQKDTAFRRALRRLGGVAAALVLLIALPQPASASEKELPAVPKEVAAQVGDLAVYYKDRVCPLQTLARDYCLKAYGKAHMGPYTAEQVVSSWFFYYDWWRGVPLKIKASEKGTVKENEKQSLVMKTASGEAFSIFPIADSTGRIEWYNPTGELPAGLEYDRWVFVRKTLELMKKEAASENWDEVSRLIAGIKKYQQSEAASVLPPVARYKAEKFYNGISRPMVPFMVSITLGLVLFVLFGLWTAKGKRPPIRLQLILAVIAGILVLYLTTVIALRWYASGSRPFAGSYAVMMLMAWVASVAQLLLWKRFPLVQPLAFLVSGFTMLMASLSSANPQITHLMPVLQSPLLSIHVLSMMVSYTLFALVMLGGIMGLFMKGEAVMTLRDLSLVILYPAVFLITFGTFIGAVWANISWGSYWGWDPKETWALITLLIYSIPLHCEKLGFLKNPRNFHIYTILAFAAVLVTYFGVNLLLGGMHSYA